MGNLLEADSNKSTTDAILFLDSLQRAFITETMLIDMLKKWNELGKPLQMIPRDFRDRILENVNKEVKLNYRKWLVKGKELDMFEVLSLIIIYSRCELNRRLELIFELFCYNDETYMQKGEFKFMMNKLCNAIAATIQMK